MGIFDRFPHSSTHEMNLDFMLGRAQEINTALQQVTAALPEVQTGLATISEKTEIATEAAEEAEQNAEAAQTHAGTAMTWRSEAMHYANQAQESAAQAQQIATTLGDIETAQEVCTDAQTAAETAATNAAGSASAAHTDAINAGNANTQAGTYAANAASSANAARSSATNANNAKADAIRYATAADGFRATAETASSNAQSAATNAQTSATNAATSATNAATAATQVLGVKEEIEDLIESLPADFTDVVTQVNTNTANITSLSDEIDHLITEGTSLAPYLFLTDKWIDASGVEQTLIGYNVYKVPVQNGDVVCFLQTSGSTKFWQGVQDANVFKLLKSDETYYTCNSSSGNNTYGSIAESPIIACFAVVPADVTHAVINVKAEYAPLVNVYINAPYNSIRSDALSVYQNVTKLNGNNTIQTIFYRSNTSKVDKIIGDYRTYTLKIKSGDIVTFNKLLPALTFYASFTDAEMTTTRIAEQSFTAPSDGILSVFDLPGEGFECILYPANSIKIEYKNIKNIPDDETVNPFLGLSAVAFGTSLTYRDQGYRPNLATLLNMSIDNQGVGSSYWCADAQNNSNVLYNVQNYTSYTGKDVCIIEGCVNDWYYEHTIGTYKDTGTATVCGCLYNMISHVYTQNPNIQIFVILDHFGRNYSSVDCSSASLRGGKTQYEYYEELAKLCAFYGIPCIKEYEISSIGQFGTAYLADNIHLSALGGQQSAMVIANAMMQYGRKKTA